MRTDRSVHERSAALAAPIGDTVGVAARDHASGEFTLADPAQQDWREKIPAGVPCAQLEADKTGGVGGTGNDAAIVFTPSRAPVVMAVYRKGLSLEAEARASAAVAEGARVPHEHLGGTA